MCLGESTTQGQYPPYLAEILNQRNIGIKFSVIDKGMSNIETGVILAQLESNIDKYQPDIVVTMMGCNDRRTMYYQDIPESDTWLFKHCRAYRFSRLIYMRILKKLKKEDIYGVKSPYPNQGKPIKIKGFSKNAVRLNPKDNSVHQALGWLYRDQGRLVEAEQAFKKAIQFTPDNDCAYTELGQLYKDQGRLVESEQAFKKAIELNPINDSAYVALGWLYKDQGRLFEQEEVFKKAVELNPRNDSAYVALGWFYRNQRRFAELEQILKKSIELNPGNDSPYTALGWLYKDQGRLLEEEQAFKKAIELNPQNVLAYAGLATVYGEMGKSELSREYTEKANKLIDDISNPTTINNYRRLKQILDKRRIRLVCVQYPMRSIQSLRKIFQYDEDMIFVDNKEIFRDAVRKEGYSVYFRDMFGGNFGHCTQKGNRILAKNIANTILREVFGNGATFFNK